jgi:hypothetical protein
MKNVIFAAVASLALAACTVEQPVEAAPEVVEEVVEAPVEEAPVEEAPVEEAPVAVIDSPAEETP